MKKASQIEVERDAQPAFTQGNKNTKTNYGRRFVVDSFKLVGGKKPLKEARSWKAKSRSYIALEENNLIPVEKGGLQAVAMCICQALRQEPQCNKAIHLLLSEGGWLLILVRRRNLTVRRHWSRVR